MGLDVLQRDERAGWSSRNIVVLFLHYLICSEKEERHLQTKGFGANIKCRGWVGMKYVIYPLA